MYLMTNWEDDSMTRIVVTLTSQLITTNGIYAPRFFSGTIIALVNLKGRPYSLVSIDYSAGEFYEHDYTSDFIYDGVAPRGEDIANLKNAVKLKLKQAVYGRAA